MLQQHQGDEDAAAGAWTSVYVCEDLRLPEPAALCLTCESKQPLNIAALLFL